MSEESAPVAEVQSYALPADAPAEMTVSEAARMLSQARQKSQEPPAASAKEATADEPELAQEADADQEQSPGESETQEAEPEENLPPIDPPRSWTKDEKETFKSWPREAQESIARVTSTREADFRRSQNEAAEARKAANAAQAEAQEITKKLAAKLPELESAARDYMGRQYPEFKTYDDVLNMSRQAEALSQTDPFMALQLGNRVQAWREEQNAVSFKLQETRDAAKRLEQERGQNLLQYRNEEGKKVEEFFPELKDPKKLKALTEKAVDHLKGFDLSDQQLGEYAAQGEKPFIFSAAFQRILLNSVKYEEARGAPARAIPNPLPPVQRPGVAKGNQSRTLQIQNLETQLSKATGNQAIRLAADLTRLKRAR